MPGHILDNDTLALWRFDETAPGHTSTTTYRQSAEANGNYDLQSTSAASAPWIQGGPLTGLGLGTDYCRWFGYPTDDRDLIASGDATASTALKGPAWTMEAWIYVYRDPGTPTTATKFIVDYRGASETEDTNGLGAFRVFSDGTLGIFWEAGAGANFTVQGTASVPLNQWVHVAAIGVENGANRDVSFYIGGVFDVTDSTTKATGGTNATWYVGRNRDSTVSFAGGIAYLRVSTVARTPTEISNAAANPTAITNDGNTLAFWPLQDLPDHYDLSRNGHHLISRSLSEGSNPPTQLFGVSGPLSPLNTSFCRRYTSSSSDSTVAPVRTTFVDALLGANEYTVELWANTLGETGLVEFLRILATGETEDTNLTLSFRVQSGDLLEVFYETGAGVNHNLLTSLPFRGAVPRERRRWYHLAVRKRSVGGGQSEWDVFVNGQLFETLGPDDDPTATGYEANNAYEIILHNGSLEVLRSDMRVSSIARTDTEILESYTRGLGAVGAPEAGVTSLSYVMRASNLAQTSYLFWEVQDAADFTGAFAPGPISPGTAIAIAEWSSETTIYQVARDVGVDFTTTDVPLTLPRPESLLFILTVDTASVNWPANGTVSLYSPATVGDHVIVKDGTGSSDTKPIVVNGNGALIDGSSTQVINGPYESRTYLFTNSGWKAI